MSEQVALVVTYDPVLVSESFLAEHVNELEGIENLTITEAPDDVLAAAQEAVNAAYGDSNDKEIELYRDALEIALSALGLSLPEGQDPDDDDA